MNAYRFLLLLLIVAALICFCSCNNDDDPETSSGHDDDTTDDDTVDDDTLDDDTSDDDTGDDDTSDDIVSEAVFVENGEPLSVTYQGAPWTTQNGWLGQMGDYQFLHGGYRALAGDFEVTARLRIAQLSRSGAAFVIDGNNRIVFAARDNHLRLQGPLFPDDEVDLGPTLAQDSTPFEILVVRAGEQLNLYFDNQLIYSQAVLPDRPLTFGLLAGKSTTSVSDFYAAGRLLPLPEQPEAVDVFVGGEDGYDTFRIPALIATPGGVLLAFAEGRKRSSSDTGNIDLVLKRSFDGGATWQPLQVVADFGYATCGNPAPIIDRDSGDVVLPFTYNQGWTWEPLINLGIGSREVYLTRSHDGGASWDAPIKISDDVKLDGWRWYATGPGHGIQLSSGRMVVPCDHCTSQLPGQSFSHAIVSDDGGYSWRLGGVVPGGRTNECIVAERDDGTLLLNMRNLRGTDRRAVSLSYDEGESWTAPVDDEELIEPVCQASMLELDGNRLLFANPASTHREVMAVRGSEDGGDTWPSFRWIDLGPAAYSDLTRLPDGEIGLLYERGDDSLYETITFVAFSEGFIF